MRAFWTTAIFSIAVLSAVDRALPAPPASKSNSEPDAPLVYRDDGSTAPPGALSPEAQGWIKSQKDWPADPDGKRTLAILIDGDEWDGDLAALRKMPSVNRLWLERSFSEAGLENLRGLKTIQSVVFEWEAHVTGRELQIVATMPNLRELEINEGSESGDSTGCVGDEALATLSHLPNLISLKLAGSPISEDGLQILRRFPKLRVLRIDSPKLTWDSLSKFPRLEKLEVLEFNANPRQGEGHMDSWDEDMELPPKLPGTGAIRDSAAKRAALSIKARSWIADYKTWPAYCDGKHLLEIKKIDEVSDADLAALEFMPGVNRVWIYHKFSHAGLSRLCGLKTVQSLMFGLDVPVDDDVLKAIARIPSLRSLEVVRNSTKNGPVPAIDDAGFIALSELPELQALTLRTTNVSESILAHLKDFPELRELRIGSPRLSWDCLSRFPKLAKLQTLELSCAPVGPAPAAR